MKIEKLRKNHKKEIIIGTILTVVIGGALTFKLTHSKYRVTQSIDLGSGVINYTVPDFKIMAVKISDDGKTYNDSDTVPTTGYTLNTTNSSCKVNDIKDDSITINYHDGVIGIDNLSKKGTKCYLYFDKINNITIDNIIAKYVTAIEKSDFSSVATDDEGVFKAVDGIYNGTTYYWRGAATTNHVIFAEKCWRIVRINGNKTMRLIYNGTVQSGNTCKGNGSNSSSIAVTNQKYNSSYSQSNYVGWTYSGTSQRTTGGTDSNAKSQTETWYNNNIGNNTEYASKVADGKFCNNRSAGSGYTWAISPSNEFSYEESTNASSKIPSTSCPSGDVYTLKVGAITVSEIIFAGGTNNKSNTSYYLYNGQNYWTMSPSGWKGTCFLGNDFGDCSGATVFHMYSSGFFNNYDVHASTNFGIRPVINLKADTTFASNSLGTSDSPYIVQ